MIQSEAQEFDFVKDVPQREKSRLRKIWDHFVELKAVAAEHGMLIPVKLAANIAGVSKQRIHELMESGKLKRVDVLGQPMVAENQFIEWARSERSSGRPLKLPKTVSEKWKAGQGAVAERRVGSKSSSK